jgi:hypothetical protein
VIVGLPPQADIHELENIALGRNDEDGKKSRNIFSNNHHQVHAVSNLEPQVLFAYPPEKPLPLKYKDTLSFCLPEGVQVHAVERTPSFSELNEILLGQEQLKESSQSFVFRLQVADDSTLYGCCVLVEEIVQRPSKLVSMLTKENPIIPRRSRYVITTPRCYCILSRFPFFELHFGMLQSILMEERLEWLTDGVRLLASLSPEDTCRGMIYVKELKLLQRSNILMVTLLMWINHLNRAQEFHRRKCLTLTAVLGLERTNLTLSLKNSNNWKVLVALKNRVTRSRSLNVIPLKGLIIAF